MKKLTKRKIYQKRRKKEKEQQRKSSQRLEKQRQQTSHQGVTTSVMTANRKYAGPRQTGAKTTATTTNNRYIQHSLYTNPVNSYTEGMRQWWQTYCTAICYHSEQRRRWNEMIDKDLKEHQGIYRDINTKSLLQQYAEEYETSSDEEEDEMVNNLEPEDFPNLPEELQSVQEDQPEDEEEELEEEIDEEYLKFLEITHRHREELKLKRAAENC